MGLTLIQESFIRSVRILDVELNVQLAKLTFGCIPRTMAYAGNFCVFTSPLLFQSKSMLSLGPGTNLRSLSLTSGVSS